MKATAERITNILKSSTDVTDLVGNRIYWGLGRQKENEAAIVFSVQEQVNGASADSRSWATTIRVYAGDMDQASDVYEALMSVMATEGYFQSGASGISDDEAKEAVMELTYNLK